MRAGSQELMKKLERHTGKRGLGWKGSCAGRKTSGQLPGQSAGWQCVGGSWQLPIRHVGAIQVLSRGKGERRPLHIVFKCLGIFSLKIGWPLSK